MASAVDPTSSPRSARPSRNLSAPWSHIAAAAPSASSAEPIPLRDSSERSVQKLAPDSPPPPPPPPPESPDHVIDGNAVAAAKGKKTVWNVPSNGSTEGGAVMDALCWPALSGSARASPKSSSSDSLKGLSDGSILTGPVSPTSKPACSTPNPNITSSPSSSARHKTVKHVATNAVSDAGSSGGGMPNGGMATPSPSPTLSQISQPMPDGQPSPKGLTNMNSYNNNNGLDISSRTSGTSHQPHGGNDQHRGYGGGRRGNNGQYNSYGNRRDPERGGYDWNHRNFVRDVPMQQLHPQWGVRSYARPPPVAAQLIAPPPPPRPFSHNMGFHDMSSAVYYVPAPPHPDSLRAIPFAPVPAPPVMFIPAPDPQRAILLKQIDYYFSPENLCKDTYLRSHMDDQGWVHVSVIADFNRSNLHIFFLVANPSEAYDICDMDGLTTISRPNINNAPLRWISQVYLGKQYLQPFDEKVLSYSKDVFIQETVVKLLTKNVQYILDTLRSSSVVEVQGDKIRRRNDWSIWVMNKGNDSGSSGSHSATPTNYDALSTQFYNVGLEENSSNTAV